MGGFGFFLPRFVLKRKIRERQMRIRLACPTLSTLPSFASRPDLALDQAMMRVGEDLRHAHPDLSDEFHLVNLEMRAGKPRAEALRNLADAPAWTTSSALVGTLVQTDRFGTSVAQAFACIQIRCELNGGNALKNKLRKPRSRWSSPLFYLFSPLSSSSLWAQRSFSWYALWPPDVEDVYALRSISWEQ